MYAPERHQAILEQARANGRVEVRELAELLRVTPETIRRDLTSLERRGLVRRAHGGAIPVERSLVGPAVSERNEIRVAEKLAIATAAIDELPDGGSILIDAGTTTIKLAELIPTDRRLTVVTHSLPVAIALADRDNIELHVLGGLVRPTSRATVGTWTHQMVSMVSVDVAFISINGITPERGLTTHNIAEAAVKSAIIKASRRSIVLADHSKFGREEFSRVAPLAAIDTIITDAGVNEELVHEVEASGPDVILAGPSATPAVA
ncbi:DeoR/GlpR transcriptional regulator [Salinibacterium sp. dk2585]|uniref:DeoR/GlpR family DNA-binding transcription regulator n=1 Tax=unclassified Salinibacterium TaxID=2632331 RepID=UPI0011C25648|nr:MULTISPECIES: DeoR/GlpR family DNA-binding transcription regulator [unclassified Salinibacterium]QEE60788.1 DeoR/GlpR transcriptional regulator [Salinibacterium sp. dk2585]TXK55860.1 DeoR/GlpR transcriptional regulator [Salinibacterium sp. dk5596]